MPDKQPDADTASRPLPWFEGPGASAFSLVGAAVGLTLSLLLVSSGATESPAAPNGAAASPTAHAAAPAASPAPPRRVAQAGPPPAQARVQHPVAVEGPPAPAAAPPPATAPPAPISFQAAAGPKDLAGAAADTLAQEAPEPAARSATAVCGYAVASGQTCRNLVSGGGYCHLHRAPEAAPAYSGATGGTVHVRGYYRKDGTYVRPHTRGAPRRR
jgi:hypothetical protein